MKKRQAPSCDRDQTSKKGVNPKRRRPVALRTRAMKHRADYSWTGVGTQRYKLEDGTWADVIRRTLVGDRGEQTKFHLRYFEVAPGGHTSPEIHRHEHVVVCVRGRGKCKVGSRTYKLGFLDTVYIPPYAPHKLANTFDEPFGFFCIVDAKRDRPRPIR